MAFIYLKGDTRAVERALRDEPKRARAAAVSALNKVAAQAQTAGVRELASKVKLPQRFIKQRVKLQRARPNRLEALLITLTAGVPVDRLGYRELKKGGISAASRRFPHAFRAFRKSTNERKANLVFERRGEARLPIDRVKIPLNPDADMIFNRLVRTFVATRFDRLFARELAFRLGRR